MKNNDVFMKTYLKNVIKEDQDQKMKVSELISKLETLKEKYGDIEVKLLDDEDEPFEIQRVEYSPYEKAICIAQPYHSPF